jgi:hypothetical protein
MKFIKDIVSVGDYDIPDGKGGVHKESLSIDRFKKWAGNFHEMKAAGLRIPAPWVHYSKKDGKPLTPIAMGHAEMPSADENAGFWDSLFVDEERGVLVGVVDAPGADNDFNSPAGKIGKTVKETSVYIAPSFTDPKTKKTWNEVPLHIACVLHPIESNQGNFVPIEEGMAIAMSFKSDAMGGEKKPEKKPVEKPGEKPLAGKPKEDYSESVDDPNKVLGSGDTEAKPSGNDKLGEVIRLLREAAEVALPEDTTPDNLIERLLIALTQKSVEDEDEDEGTITQPPEGAQQRNAPFIMALSPTQIAAIVASKPVNPETGKPFTNDELVGLASQPVDVEVVMSHPKVKQIVDTSNQMAAALKNQAQAGYRNRIDALVKRGQVGKEQAEKSLLPMVDSLVMSFSPEGKPVEQPLDTVLKLLESAAPATPVSGVNPYAEALAMSHGTMPPNGVIPPSPFEAFGSPDGALDVETQKAVMGRLRNSGILN